MTTTEPLKHLDAEPPNLGYLYGLIEGSASQLHDNMRTGYTRGYETVLADAVLTDYLPANEQRDEYINKALEMLLDDRMREFITVDCLLDETKPGSDVTVEEMTRVLLSEIQRQEGEYDALRRLVVAAIVAQERVEGLNRQWHTTAGGKYDDVREIPCWVIANGLLVVNGEWVDGEHPELRAEIERRGWDVYHDHSDVEFRDGTPVAVCTHGQWSSS